MDSTFWSFSRLFNLTEAFFFVFPSTRLQNTTQPKFKRCVIQRNLRRGSHWSFVIDFFQLGSLIVRLQSRGFCRLNIFDKVRECWKIFSRHDHRLKLNSFLMAAAQSKKFRCIKNVLCRNLCCKRAMKLMKIYCADYDLWSFLLLSLV